MEWKKIEDYDYSINENGQVRNDKTGNILKATLDSIGYYGVKLYKNSEAKTFRIHRLLGKYFLEDFNEISQVDHIDRNRTNNNLDNLRMVSQQQNIWNTTKQKNCTSIYKGVYHYKRTNKWIAAITINKKRIHLGCYDKELEAAQSYNKYLEENNLEYYPKNII